MVDPRLFPTEPCKWVNQKNKVSKLSTKKSKIIFLSEVSFENQVYWWDLKATDLHILYNALFGSGIYSKSILA